MDRPLQGEAAFQIIASVAWADASTPVSPEISVCDDCLREMNNPADRRRRYPFINCTKCGPRFTIIEELPYDRRFTTMKSFPMCAGCSEEYENPADRRYHAQPNACPACGPKIWWVNRDASEDDFLRPHPVAAIASEQAIAAFHDAIRRGQIVAVKGIGGFHLACDATNDHAIETLRRRKGRIEKPFAVMASSVAACEAFAWVNARERALLESNARPIVLLRKRKPDAGSLVLSTQAAPGNHFIGLMLPYSPLHVLLCEGGVPLVMTSGNRSDEPIARENGEARTRLYDLADGFLLHDREIHSVCDDSVVRCCGDSLLPIRRSRGYAPLPVRLVKAGPSVLAVGGELKATFCIAQGDYAYLSPHLGDMENLETLAALRRSVDHFLRLFRVKPEAIAADLHPDYLSTQLARQLASERGIPLVQVQHHQAHLASLQAEYGMDEAEPLLGVVFDGSGFGSDGAIWGGEFLLAQGRDWERVGHLEYLPLPGGDAAIRNPYRLALAYLFAVGRPWNSSLPCVQDCEPAARNVLRQQLERNLHCPSTSSMGRLFDAVAAMIGVRQTVNYEGQAAIELESLAADMINDPSARTDEHRWELPKSGQSAIPLAGVIAKIENDVLQGVDARIIAARFHLAVAQLIVDFAVQMREQRGVGRVALTGGVFQNVLLLELVESRLQQRAFEVFSHRLVPPNDGGLALGQARIAQQRLINERGSGANQ